MPTPNPDFQLSIPKDEIHTLPPISFNAQIQVVDTLPAAHAALRELTRAKTVGFDTETRPSFHKGRLNKVALMQLSTPSTCYLIRLNKLGIFPMLKNFLENPAVTKVGLSVHDDFHVLSRIEPLQPQGFIDLQALVKDYRIADTSLQKIFAIIFGQYISKSQRLTNWEADQLTPQQQRYAAIDAWACIQTYNTLLSGSFNPSQSPYIKQPLPEHHPSTQQTS